MPSNLNTAEQLAKNKEKREYERLKKQRLRAKDAEQAAIDELIKLEKDEPGAAQQAIWARNRAKLTTDELKTLEKRQDELLRHAAQVQDVITYLPKGRKIGPPDGLPFPDTLYDDCVAGGFVGANDGTKLVFHIMGEEFADLYRDITDQAFQHFNQNIDREWFLYGFYVRFVSTQWHQFVDVISTYIQSRPDESHLPEELRLDPEICSRIIADWQTRQPRHRPEMTHNNLLESAQRADYRTSAAQVDRDIKDAQKSLLDPFNLNYQF